MMTWQNMDDHHVTYGCLQSPKRPDQTYKSFTAFFVMALSTFALSSPAFTPHRTKFELSSLISLKSRFRVNFRRARAAGIFCNYSCLEVRDVCYRPPGTQVNILNGVSFSLPEKSFGLIFGRSGSGKTTLLQLLAGLSKPTSEKVGIVFQFPERYFVADNVLDEVTFGWPRQSGSFQLKEYLTLNLQRAINWVGLNGISLDKDPHSLSGGYKRRLALAIQLVQIPDLLILDEPLAGLDWKARADVVKLLEHLKKELTILVVSHDLKEMAALIDHSWRMDMGGFLIEEQPPVIWDSPPA
ncbi:ABC transporter-like protein [Melia azedarach]|uniref:ABC transporter-like protein n=1 Tax=Melia azedarach TaxID=155640 RepID=A0ACC1Z2G6_MELAZ|nr:ABC transporter-like protein [Melia azedarach]